MKNNYLFAKIVFLTFFILGFSACTNSVGNSAKSNSHEKPLDNSEHTVHFIVTYDDRKDILEFDLTGKGQEKITIPDSYIPADYKPASYKPHKPTVFADADEYEIKLENKYDYYQSKSDENKLDLPVIYRDFIGFENKGSGEGYITKEQAELYGIPFVVGRGHPDFSPEKHTDFSQKQLGMVSAQLGEDGFPVLLDTSSFRPENQLTEKSFDMWFKDYPGINKPIKKSLNLIKTNSGGWWYRSASFLPLSVEEGFGKDIYKGKNIDFTLVMDFYLNYTGNEILTFESDDDMWVFINGKLAYDCGGLHHEFRQSISLSDMSKSQILQDGKTIEYKYDENYNIVEGQRVEIKIFKAERFYGGSTFEIESTTDLFERRMKTE